MGGFELYDSNGERLHPLDFENIEKLVQRGAIDFSNITENEIKDRSKGDVISKGLSVVQTGWFIAQCIARGAEHLAITELEIMTVAFAFLNFVTYIFWWNKPLNVTCPIRIVLKEGHSAPQPGPSEPGPPQRVLLEDRFWRMFLLTDPNRDDELKVDLCREKRVPTFYVGKIELESKSFWTLEFVGMIITVVFGGIHCIAWSFAFPTHVEQILWRASSIAIISIPIYFFLAAVLALLARGLRLPFIFGLLLVFLPTLIYVFSRLTLLILSFISLRSLPPSAFYAIPWTTFIPHVG
jgi:hypothetical protein